MGIVRPGHLQGEFNAAAAVDAVVEMYGDAAEHGEYLPVFAWVAGGRLARPARPGLSCHLAPAVRLRVDDSQAKTGTNVEAGRKERASLTAVKGARRGGAMMGACLPFPYILLRLEAP